jgi:bifunctional oligoribonuclease and PAP phosphatase NrnA
VAQILTTNDLFEDLAKQAYKLIQNASKITLLTHYNPDADGISACAALSTMLKKNGKVIESIYPTKSEFFLKRHPANVLINQHRQIPDLIIICDTSTIERFYFPKEFKGIPNINIDHHISNTIKATVNLVVSQASSTCEILYFLMQAWEVDILLDVYVAECLLMGILYDCQTFHTKLTNANTLRVAANLIDTGASLYQLHEELLNNKNPKIITFWGKLLSNITISPNGSAAWISIHQKDLQILGLKLSSIIGFSNFLAQLSNVDVTIVFYETEQMQTKVSLRSKKTDVNKFSAQFGGGGHKNAAGILSDKSLNEVVQEVTCLFD